MSGKTVPSEIVLTQSQALYLIHLLIFIIVAAPKRTVAEEQHMWETRDEWNRYRFDRKKVWSWLAHTFGTQQDVLKQAHSMAELRTLLQHVYDEKGTFSLSTLTEDAAQMEALYLDAAQARECIRTLADIFRSTPDTQLDEQLLERIPESAIATGTF